MEVKQASLMSSNLVQNLGENMLGIFSDSGVIYLFYSDKGDNSGSLSVELSPDGEHFEKFKDKIKLTDQKGQKIPGEEIVSLNVSKVYDNYFLAFKRRSGNDDSLSCAVGRDFDSFSVVSEIEGTNEGGVLVPNFKHNGNYLFFFGGDSIRAAVTSDFGAWKVHDKPIVAAHQNFYGQSPLTVGNVIATDEGLLLIYFVNKSVNGLSHWELKAVVLDRNNPYKIKRHVDNVLWETPADWAGLDIKPVGIAKVGDSMYSYWTGHDKTYAVLHPFFLFESEKKHFAQVILNRLAHNPIIKPIVENFWESKAVFNPAAIYDKGKVHIIYRAVGDGDVSVLGYAASFDGINIDERLNSPIYVPTQPFEASGIYPGNGAYTSGGGCYGGCEDPRVTKIDERLYMTYVAYDGGNPPRVAMTSINFEDFVNHDFKWEKPVLISKPGVVDKNACILSEKINGKYVIFHRIYPNILIDFVDELNFDGSTFLEGKFSIKPRENYWDSRKVGIGPPPIKTDDGWLLIYQAVGDDDPGRYKMGAMLLALDNPTNVLARSNEPILAPDFWYENEGHKSGVVYPCGAVRRESDLIIYYGGADSVVCAASAKVEEFVEKLKDHKEIDMLPKNIQRGAFL